MDPYLLTIALHRTTEHRPAPARAERRSARHLRRARRAASGG